MRADIVGCIVLFAAGTLAGCGFKSDLFLPEETPADAVTNQAIPAEQSASDPAFFSSGEVEDGNIMLDKVTNVASDGEILVTTGSEENNTEVDQAAEGIPVDLSDLTSDP